jgi:glutamate/tyrosine decarboxylase-like PLP-dependent enzyme
LVDRCCERARQIARLLAVEPGVHILNDVVINQVLVRFSDDDDTTRHVVSAVQNEGICWLSGTTWHDMAAMRISVSNWATSENDVVRSAESILGEYRRVRAGSVARTS